MGILKGDVDLIGLAPLLQALSMNQRQGVLTLFRDQDRKSIHIGPDGMRLLESTMKRPNRLGRILLRRRQVSVAHLKAVLEEQRRSGGLLAARLLKARLVTPAAVQAALREQIEEEIFDMFMWEDAAFEFHEGPPRKSAGTPLSEVPFDANITSLLLEAARRHDELRAFRKLVRSEKMILVRTTHEIFAGLLEEDRECVDAVFPIIDGRRTVGEIVQHSIFPRFATLRALHRLVSSGFVKPVSPGSETTAILARERTP